jgi:hypothetical protein
VINSKLIVLFNKIELGIEIRLNKWRNIDVFMDVNFDGKFMRMRIIIKININNA